MYNFINYINYFDIMHSLHLIRLTHVCMYVFTFYIIAVIRGLIMTVLMTLFINIKL